MPAANLDGPRHRECYGNEKKHHLFKDVTEKRGGPRAGSGPKPQRYQRPQAGWLVAETLPKAEHAALDMLRRLGFHSYLPLYAVRVRNRRTRAYTIAERPLFPGYLFTHWTEGEQWWSTIRAAPGVRALIMDGERPSICPEAQIRALQAGDELRRTPTAPGAAWPPGTPCSLATGVFKGAPAVVVSAQGETARIALVMLGGLRTISLPIAHLMPRDE